jgi:Fe-S-cluster-containing hydrogenase component 2
MTDAHFPRADALEVPPAIDPEHCTGCTQCLLICPVAAIRREGLKCVLIDSECVRCGRCLDACPTEAVSARPKGEREEDTNGG